MSGLVVVFFYLFVVYVSILNQNCCYYLFGAKKKFTKNVNCFVLNIIFNVDLKQVHGTHECIFFCQSIFDDNICQKEIFVIKIREFLNAFIRNSLSNKYKFIQPSNIEKQFFFLHSFAFDVCCTTQF